MGSMLGSTVSAPPPFFFFLSIEYQNVSLRVSVYYDLVGYFRNLLKAFFKDSKLKYYHLNKKKLNIYIYIFLKK